MSEPVYNCWLLDFGEIEMAPPEDAMLYWETGESREIATDMARGIWHLMESLVEVLHGMEGGGFITLLQGEELLCRICGAVPGFPMTWKKKPEAEIDNEYPADSSGG